MGIFETEEIERLLQEYNPWWQSGAESEELPGVRRQAYYETLEQLQSRDLRRFVVLSGARRVGKTTVMRQLIAELLATGVKGENILYLSFDNPIIKLAGVKAAIDAFDKARPRSSLCYFFFDEIQYAEDWSLWLKVLYDTRPALQLVATGSASPHIEKGARDSGVGRWRVLRMPTLSFREYCDIMQLPLVVEPQVNLETLLRMESPEFTRLMRRFSGLEAHWNRYLSLGGFPELLGTEVVARAQRVLREDVVDKVLKRDIPALFDVRNTLQLEKLYLYFCVNSGNIINTAAMCRALEGVSLPTLMRYMEFLRDANLIYISQASNYTGKKGISSQPKVYVADAALSNASLMRNPASVTDEVRGMMAETTVYKHFHSAYGAFCRVGYIRLPRTQKEVDVVVDFPNERRYLCEVKYRHDSSVSQRDAINTLCREQSAQAAIIATRHVEDFGLSAEPDAQLVYRIPCPVLCYLLGYVVPVESMF